MTLGEFLSAVADTLPIWRDTAIVVLGLIAIGALWLFAELAL